MSTTQFKMTTTKIENENEENSVSELTLLNTNRQNLRYILSTWITYINTAHARAQEMRKQMERHALEKEESAKQIDDLREQIERYAMEKEENANKIYNLRKQIEWYAMEKEVNIHQFVWGILFISTGMLALNVMFIN